ncbi:MAG: GAF domain-containing SpoIIE family protein phosphatase [Planctomycetota bacterium]
MRNLFFSFGRGGASRGASGRSGAGRGKGGDRGPGADSSDSSFLTGDEQIDAANIRSLLDTMAELISDIELDRLLVSVVDRSIRLVNAERGILFLHDGSEGGRLKVRVARDARGSDLTEPLQYSTTVVARAQEGTPQCLKVGESDREIDLSRSVVDLKLRAVMCVRLRVKEESLGVIYVDSRASAREFTRADLRFFDALANALSIAIANARLVAAALERERMRESLNIARRIQIGLLPRDPHLGGGWDVAGWTLPCEETAGDYYDFLPLPRDRRPVERLGIVVGDVSGHGVGPALLMSSARALLRAFTATGMGVGEVVGRVNQQLSEDLEADMFMSLFFGVLDLRGRTLTYANAGQTPPLLLRAGRDESLDLAATGPALGIVSEADYGVSRLVELEPGDSLVLFTDGILEAKNPEGEVFGRERLRRVLAQSHRQEVSASSTIGVVRDEVRRFVGTNVRGDDLTLAIIRVGRGAL